MSEYTYTHRIVCEISSEKKNETSEKRMPLNITVAERIDAI